MATSGGSRVRAITTVLTLVVLGVLAVVGVRAYAEGHLNGLVCGGPCGPEAVAAPESLGLTGAPGEADPAPQARAAIDAAALAEAVEPALEDADLGDRVGVSMVAADGTALLEREPTRAAVPASVTKVVVGYAALQTMDPQTRFATRTVLDGDRVVLVGGGDPYLGDEPPEDDADIARADLETLARRTAESLRERGDTAVSLGYDAGLFGGPAESPGWEDFYVPQQIVTPVSALWVDRGVRENGQRDADPARAAAERFGDLLRDQGIDVDGDPSGAEASPAAAELGVVRSATLARIVDRLMVSSDNEAAEVVLRHVGLATGRDGSFDGGAAAVRATLEAAEIPTPGLRLTDGSGLARENRIAPVTLARTLQGAQARASTSRLLSDLPVAGLNGTLADRYDDGGTGAVAGLVRAKTGTLTGVHALAGYAVDARGVPIYFAVMADETQDRNGLATQDALDEIAAAVAECSCSVAVPGSS